MSDATGNDTIYDYAVVGAGLIGSAAARHLSLILKKADAENDDSSNAPQQRRLLLIGPGEPTSDKEKAEREIFGAHYDEGRITRVEGCHLSWSQFAKKSIERYRGIEKESGIKFYTEAGYLIVVPKDGDYYKSALAVSESKDLELSVEELTDFSQHFPYFAVPRNSSGIYERERAGHISPRNLVEAQIKLATQNGCTLVRDVVHSVENISKDAETPAFKLTTKAGQTFTSKKVLLACGAFMNHYSLLPDGKKLDFLKNPASVCMTEISERSAQMLKNMPSMFMDCGEENDGIQVYILPPITYPDGKTYIKLGDCAIPPDWKPDVKEMADWYRSRGNPEATERLLGVLTSLIPELEVISHYPVTCVTTSTATEQLYIDEIAPGLCVACAGNGWAAKSSDEIGRLGAHLARFGKLDCDFDRDLFKARFVET